MEFVIADKLFTEMYQRYSKYDLVIPSANASNLKSCRKYDKIDSIAK